MLVMNAGQAAAGRSPVRRQNSAVSESASVSRAEPSSVRGCRRAAAMCCHDLPVISCTGMRPEPVWAAWFPKSRNGVARVLSYRAKRACWAAVSGCSLR